MSDLFHLAQKADLDEARKSGSYACASLASEGFVHCCTPSQLRGVVERYYRDASSLHLLSLDATSLAKSLTWENTVGGEELFPHVYGPIPLASILSVTRCSAADVLAADDPAQL